VYLYFPSKEELLLAVHERNLDVFFSALNGLFDRGERVLVDDMLAITNRYMVGRPLFLPLAARCFALMAQSIPAAAADAFRGRMAARLERAGAGVERHFPRLAPGEGVERLRHSFALTLGLWQMSSASACGAVAPLPAPPAGRDGAANDAVAARALRPFAAPTYADDLNRALRALWQAVSDPTPGPPL
jgi:AcrR family transcriptional regulator